MRPEVQGRPDMPADRISPKDFLRNGAMAIVIALGATATGYEASRVFGQDIFPFSSSSPMSEPPHHVAFDDRLYIVTDKKQISPQDDPSIGFTPIPDAGTLPSNVYMVEHNALINPPIARDAIHESFPAREQNDQFTILEIIKNGHTYAEASRLIGYEHSTVIPSTHSEMPAQLPAHTGFQIPDDERRGNHSVMSPLTQSPYSSNRNTRGQIMGSSLVNWTPSRVNTPQVTSHYASFYEANGPESVDISSYCEELILYDISNGKEIRDIENIKKKFTDCYANVIKNPLSNMLS